MEQVLLKMTEGPDPKRPYDEYPNVYTPIPPNGEACPYTGLKHAQLYNLLTGKGAAQHYVRVVNLRKPGTSKGKTLFHVGDLLRFLDAMATQQGTGLNRHGPIK